MARIVRRTPQQPTKNQPYCDGSHNDEAGNRHEVTEQYPGIRSY